MKKILQLHSRTTPRASAQYNLQRLQSALRAQRPDAPDLFSDRDEDDVEYASLLRDFELVHDEALGAERYN